MDSAHHTLSFNNSYAIAHQKLIPK